MKSRELYKTNQSVYQRTMICLQAQYPAVKPFCYHCLKQMLSLSLQQEHQLCDCSDVHSWARVKLELMTVILLSSTIP